MQETNLKFHLSYKDKLKPSLKDHQFSVSHMTVIDKYVIASKPKGVLTAIDSLSGELYPLPRLVFNDVSCLYAYKDDCLLICDTSGVIVCVKFILEDGNRLSLQRLDTRRIESQHVTCCHHQYVGGSVKGINIEGRKVVGSTDDNCGIGITDSIKVTNTASPNQFQMGTTCVIYLGTSAGFIYVYRCNEMTGKRSLKPFLTFKNKKSVSVSVVSPSPQYLWLLQYTGTVTIYNKKTKEIHAQFKGGGRRESASVSGISKITDMIYVKDSVWLIGSDIVLVFNPAGVLKTCLRVNVDWERRKGKVLPRLSMVKARICDDYVVTLLHSPHCDLQEEDGGTGGMFIGGGGGGGGATLGRALSVEPDGGRRREQYGSVLALIPMSSMWTTSQISRDKEGCSGALHTVSNVRVYVVNAGDSVVSSFACNMYPPVPDHILAVSFGSTSPSPSLKLFNLDRAACGQRTMSIFSDDCVTDKSYTEARYNTLFRSLEAVEPAKKMLGMQDNRERYIDYLGQIYHTNSENLDALTAHLSSPRVSQRPQAVAPTGLRTSQMVYNQPCTDTKEDGRKTTLMGSTLMHNILEGTRSKGTTKGLDEEIPSFSASKVEGSSPNHSVIVSNENKERKGVGRDEDDGDNAKTAGSVYGWGWTGRVSADGPIYGLPTVTDKRIQVERSSKMQEAVLQMKATLGDHKECIEVLSLRLKGLVAERDELQESLRALRLPEHLSKYHEEELALAKSKAKRDTAIDASNEEKRNHEDTIKELRTHIEQLSKDLNKATTDCAETGKHLEGLKQGRKQREQEKQLLCTEFAEMQERLLLQLRTLENTTFLQERQREELNNIQATHKATTEGLRKEVARLVKLREAKEKQREDQQRQVQREAAEVGDGGHEGWRELEESERDAEGRRRSVGNEAKTLLEAVERKKLDVATLHNKLLSISRSTLTSSTTNTSTLDGEHGVIQQQRLKFNKAACVDLEAVTQKLEEFHHDNTQLVAARAEVQRRIETLMLVLGEG